MPDGRCVVVGYAAAVPASDLPDFGPLTAAERGFVLGATLLGLGLEAGGRLAGAGGERCGSALRELAGLPRERKAGRLASFARDLGAAYPAGIDGVHPSWLRLALAAEPSDLLPALSAGGPPGLRAAAGDVLAGRSGQGPAPQPVPVTGELAAELRRAIFAALVAPTPEHPQGLLRFTGTALIEELRRLGAETLGASLAGAPSDVRARAIAGVGEAYAESVRASAEHADPAARRQGEVALKEATSGPVATIEERLESIGIAALIARLAHDEEGARALAVRLPHHLGSRLWSPAGPS